VFECRISDSHWYVAFVTPSLETPSVPQTRGRVASKKNNRTPLSDIVSTVQCKHHALAQFRLRSVGKDSANQLRVVDLAGARIDGLEQLVNLLVRHLLAQVRQDVLELADAYEARHVFVEHLEAAAVFLGNAGVAESARPVENALESLKVDCRGQKLAVCPGNGVTRGRKLTLCANVLLEVLDLRKRGVLAARAQQVAEVVQGDTAVAALVVQGESLLVVGRRLVVLVRHFDSEVAAIAASCDGGEARGVRKGAWAGWCEGRFGGK
jgi:hypothetical protein